MNSTCLNLTILKKYQWNITHMLKSINRNSEMIFQSTKCTNCITCFERCPTKINLGISMNSYQCLQCSRDRDEPNLHSFQNDTIPLTLDSRRLMELQDIMGATML